MGREPVELIRTGVKDSKGELTLPDKSLQVNPTAAATLQDSKALVICLESHTIY